MKHTLLAAAALVGIETAALACSCLATDDPVEMQKLAVDVTRNALALVEAEALTSYNQTPAGERMKVIRTLAGSAPAQFQIQRRPFASSASCDILYSLGQRDLVILYPSTTGTAGGVPLYRTSGLCTEHMLDKPAFRDAVARLIASGGPTPATERGR